MSIWEKDRLAAAVPLGTKEVATCSWKGWHIHEPLDSQSSTLVRLSVQHGMAWPGYFSFFGAVQVAETVEKKYPGFALLAYDKQRETIQANKGWFKSLWSQHKWGI